MPANARKNPGLPKLKIPSPTPIPPNICMDKEMIIVINGQEVNVASDDLKFLCVLGSGSYGVVEKVQHVKSGTILAVKRIIATDNTVETKRWLMDIDVALRSSDCPYTVHFYGAMFHQGDVMICMEVMDISLDKFYLRAAKISKPIPEEILGKIAFSVSCLLYTSDAADE